MFRKSWNILVELLFKYTRSGRLSNKKENYGRVHRPMERVTFAM
jgi:hypothetical protein